MNSAFAYVVLVVRLRGSRPENCSESRLREFQTFGYSHWRPVSVKFGESFPDDMREIYGRNAFQSPRARP